MPHPYFKLKRLAATLAILGAFTLSGCGSDSGTSAPTAILSQNIKHVLLISVDGMHQVDLANWIKNNPDSALAQLSGTSVVYTDARATTPSDSFPGLLALITGGTPKSTGVYYDDSYDRTLYAPGSSCIGSPGTEVVYDEFVDYDTTRLFSGGMNPAYLPLKKNADNTCTPVYPHNFVQVNTVFEVIKAAGGLTAWSDKHPTYDLVNGPSGTGVADLFTPEINSSIANGGSVNGVNLAAAQAQCDGATNSLKLSKVTDYTTCIPTIMAYDDVKVQAIINQIDGKKSDGSPASGVPTIFGMNFQAISVGQKLPVGGYVDASGTPSVQLNKVLAHTDASLGRMVAELKAKGLLDSTLIILSAKHGQSPIDKSTLAMEAGGSGNATVQDPLGFINLQDAGVDQTLSTFINPNSGAAYATAGHLMTDSVGIVWLQNQATANVAGVLGQLQTNAAILFANVLPTGTVFNDNITSGTALASLFGDPTGSDPIAAARAPNIFIQPNAGVIYSGSSKKIAEHGGGTVADTQVALMLSSTAFKGLTTVPGQVKTTQVAPTILKVLGLDPSQLQAVQKEGTALLPGLF